MALIKKFSLQFSTKTRAFRKRFTLITKRFYLIIQSVSFPIFLQGLWIIRLWNYSSSKRVNKDRGINFLNVIDFYWDACVQKKILYSCDYTQLKMLKNVRKLYLIDKMFLFFSTIWKIKELYFWNSINSFLKRTLERSIFKNLNLENYYIKRYFALWNFCLKLKIIWRKYSIFKNGAEQFNRSWKKVKEKKKKKLRSCIH